MPRIGSARDSFSSLACGKAFISWVAGRRSRWISCLTLSAMIAACVPFLAPRGRFVRPQVNFVGMRLVEGTSSGIVILVDLDVLNKSEESLRVEGYTYRAEINRLPIATGEDAAVLELPGMGEVRVAVPVAVTFRDLKAAWSRIDWFQGGFEQVVLSVAGTITIERLGLKFPVPFSVSRPLKSVTRRFSRGFLPGPDFPEAVPSPREQPTPP